MDPQIMYRRCSVMQWFVSLWLAASLARAEEIKGTIAKVEGTKCEISTAAELLPAVGDTMTISAEIAGIGQAEVGTAKVTRVEGGRIEAQVQRATGRVEAGQSVVINSPDPTRRMGAKVPLVIGRTGADAKKAMEAAGFAVEFRVGLAAPDRVKPFTVYAQNPAPGAELPIGGTVTLTLYADNGMGTPMPDPPDSAPAESRFPPWPTIKPDLPWLGVSRWWANQRNVVLCGVLKDGPTGKAGLKTDDTILSIDGEEIGRNSGLHEATERHRPGDEVVIEIERDGVRKSVSVTLEQIPPDGGNGRILAAAEAGEAWAMMDIGVRYANMRGDISYFERDDAEAVRWFRRSIEAGYTAGPLFLAHMYRTGRGVEQDHARAAELYEHARNAQGHGIHKGLYTSATSMLASHYLNGWGVAQDYQRALELYESSAERGSLSAMYQVGKMHENGQGTPKDSKQAMKWYNNAAKEGYGKAQHEIGLAAYQGRGVRKNHHTRPLPGSSWQPIKASPIRWSYSDICTRMAKGQTGIIHLLPTGIARRMRKAAFTPRTTWARCTKSDVSLSPNRKAGAATAIY